MVTAEVYNDYGFQKEEREGYCSIGSKRTPRALAD